LYGLAGGFFFNSMPAIAFGASSPAPSSSRSRNRQAGMAKRENVPRGPPVHLRADLQLPARQSYSR